MIALPRHPVYLSLGSNIEPRRHLRDGLAELRTRLSMRAVSPVYRSPACGFVGPDFLNLAVFAETDMDPLSLHVWLHEVEAHHGRRRDVPRYSSHTLDIDLVLFADMVLDVPGLSLPRPDLACAYVLKPLVDIAPDLPIPGSTLTLGKLWQDSAPSVRGAVERVDDILDEPSPGHGSPAVHLA